MARLASQGDGDGGGGGGGDGGSCNKGGEDGQCVDSLPPSRLHLALDEVMRTHGAMPSSWPAHVHEFSRLLEEVLRHARCAPACTHT